MRGYAVPRPGLLYDPDGLQIRVPPKCGAEVSRSLAFTSIVRCFLVVDEIFPFLIALQR